MGWSVGGTGMASSRGGVRPRLWVCLGLQAHRSAGTRRGKLADWRGGIAGGREPAQHDRMKIPALLAILAMFSTLSAQTPPPAPPAPPAPPTESRQFDFWIGEWEVFGPKGKKQGDSRIEVIATGWGLLENWTGAGGYNGKSLNTWIPQKKRWQQFWVGDGGALELSGGLNDKGEMVLSGRQAANDGKETIERITWTPNADGTVRQHWESSADNGATWTTSFDGLYRKKTK